MLGIDPGYARCGWAILDDGRLVKCDTIRTVRICASQPIDSRAREVFTALSGVVSLYAPDLIAIEGWGYQGDRSHGPQGAAISRLIGRLEGLAAMSKAACVVADTSKIKRALGCVGKRGVEGALILRGYVAKTDHEFDAIAAAWYGERALGMFGNGRRA